MKEAVFMDKQNKKLNAIPVVLLILLVCVIGVFIFLRPRISFKEERVFERDVKYRAEDVIDRSSGTITPEAEYLFTKDVGNYEFHYHIRKFVFEKDEVFTYEVVDTTAPVIDFKQTKILKDPNEEYSDEQIRENISINEGSYEYETDYDAAVSGPYSVIVTAKD